MVDHECHVHIVLEIFWEVGLYAKLEKCGFHQFEVEFLGYIISTNGIDMDLCKVQTIVDWATPTFVMDVECFLGFANIYQWVIAHYSTIVTPHTHLIVKDQPFPKELKLKMPFNVWRLLSRLLHFWFMQTFLNLLCLKRMLLTLH